MDKNELADLISKTLANTDCGIEELIDAVAVIVGKDKDNYIKQSKERNEEPHKVVVACLDSVIECLHQASFDYYASTK